MKGKSLLLPIFLFSVALLQSCVIDPGPGAIIKEGKQYGITKGPFKGKWYHYYERALSYAEGGFWAEAEADLSEALLRQRQDGDRLQALTYGVHVIEYFPHRELGIVLYHQGRYPESIKELETSLKSTISAKAEFYLDLARKAYITSRKADKRPPEILIESPVADLKTNKLDLQVAGYARDDTFVKSVNVNGRPVRIDLAAPEIKFNVKLMLKEGENSITVTATDLVNNTFSLQQTVKVDRRGPVISLDEMEKDISAGGKSIKVKGYIYDNINLQAVRLNGRELSLKKAVEYNLDEFIVLPSDVNQLTIEAIDTLGNQTKAEINLVERTSGLQRWLLASLEKPMLASNEIKSGQLGIRTIPDDVSPPSIKIKDWTEDQTVFINVAYLEGSAWDDESVANLEVNQSSILHRPAKKVFFNHLVPLRDGINHFRFEAKDPSGNQGAQAVNINRKLTKTKSIGSRMDLMVLNFEQKGTLGRHGSSSVNLMLETLKESERFNLKSSYNVQPIAMADHNTAAKVGKRLKTNYVLLGSILETENSLEIFAKIIETQTAEIITIKSVYGENVDHDKLIVLCKGLTIKLRDALPIAEGLVIKSSEKQVYIDLGKTSKIKKGMRVIVFKEGDPIVHPVTQKFMGMEDKELATALVKAVYDDYAVADIQGNSTERIERTHKVITQ